MFKLPFAFIITGMVCFALFQLAMLGSLAGWIPDYPRSPEGLARVHLLVLGWATMIAMGAVYQLIHVVLQTNIYSTKLGFVQYVCFTIGSFGLMYGFYTLRLPVIAGFATLAFTGIVLFVWNIGMTLRHAAQWNAVTVSAVCAIGYLLLTGLSGMAMGLDFAFGLLGSYHERLFAAHIWLGTLGWFGLLITGFSYKMLPMFCLAHHFPQQLQKVVLVLLNAGILLGAFAFLLHASAVWKGLSLLLIVAAMCCYNVHLLQIYKHRHKKQPGSGISWAVRSSFALSLFGIGLLVYGVAFPEWVWETKTLVMAGWMYLWGWVGLTILGYMSKIVPFLWWTHKYGPRIGKEPTPSMSVLINDKQVNVWLSVIATSLAVLLVGIALDREARMMAGGWRSPCFHSCIWD